MIETKLYLTNKLKKRHFLPSDIGHGLHGMHSKGTMPYFLKGLPYTQAKTLRHSYNTRVVTEKGQQFVAQQNQDICMSYIRDMVLLGSRLGRTQLKMIKKYSVVYFDIQPL